MKLATLLAKRETLQRERLNLYRFLKPDSESSELRRLNRRIGTITLKIEEARAAAQAKKA